MVHMPTSVVKSRNQQSCVFHFFSRASVPWRFWLCTSMTLLPLKYRDATSGRGISRSHGFPFTSNHVCTCGLFGSGRVEPGRNGSKLPFFFVTELFVKDLESGGFSGSAGAPIENTERYWIAGRALRHQILPFLLRIRLAWVEITEGTSRLFINARKSFSLR